MAQVPYQPYTFQPPEQPITPGEQLRIEATPEMFGANVGAAMERLGTTGRQVAGELFNRAYAFQDLKNETDARTQSIAATQQMAIEHENWKAQGEATGNPMALQQHLSRLEEIRQQYRGQLTNPMAQRYYDAEAARLQNSFTIQAANVSATAFKDHVVSTARAQTHNDSEHWIHTDAGPLNDQEADEKIERAKENSATEAVAKGWQVGDPREQELESKYVNGVRNGQVSIVGLTDPKGAYDILQKAYDKGEMEQSTYQEQLKYLRTQNRSINGDILAEKIYKEGGTLAEMEAKARDQAPGMALDEGDRVEFTRSVINHIRSYDMIENQATLRQRRTDEQTVLDAIHATNPLSEREFLASQPEAAAAYHRAQAAGAFKFGLTNLIDANHNDQVNQQNADNWNALRGMALRDRAGFLNITAQDLHNIQMSKTQRADILQLRKQLISAPINDPRVPQAIKALKQTHDQEMRDLGVFREPPPGADPNSTDVKNYDNFLGSLEGALDAFAAKEGRPPSGPEFEEKIAKPLLQQHAEPTMWGLWSKQRGSWYQNIPQQDLDAMRRDMENEATALGTPADFTDQEIYREVLRQQWKALLAKPAAGSTAKPK